MINLEVGKDLKLTVKTSDGVLDYFGKYVGSDENTLVLRLSAHTLMERRVYFHREKITAVEEISPGMVDAALFSTPVSWVR